MKKITFHFLCCFCVFLLMEYNMILRMEWSRRRSMTCKKGLLTVSSDHAKMGTKSLRWDWTASGALFRVNDEVNIPYAINAFNNRGGLRMWIYSPKAMPGKSLQFIFRNQSVRVYTFDFNLDFTGWRACWIAFSDMWVPGAADDVQPTQQDIDELTIKAPEGVESGTLYFDRWDFRAVYINGYSGCPNTEEQPFLDAGLLALGAIVGMGAILIFG